MGDFSSLLLLSSQFPMVHVNRFLTIFVPLLLISWTWTWFILDLSLLSRFGTGLNLSKLFVRDILQRFRTQILLAIDPHGKLHLQFMCIMLFIPHALHIVGYALTTTPRNELELMVDQFYHGGYSQEYGVYGIWVWNTFMELGEIKDILMSASRFLHFFWATLLFFPLQCIRILL